MTRVDSQAAYILHTRPYRDSSLLVEFITPEYGRVSGVVRGVRSKGKAAKQRRSMMQPLVPLLISWLGSSDLKTITHYESQSGAIVLQGKNLFSAIYVNELMTRLLQHYDENVAVFQLYEWVLQALSSDVAIDISLRQFELCLLDYLGYGVDLHAEMETGEPITANHFYLLEPDRGFRRIQPDTLSATMKSRLFSGKEIAAIEQGQFDDQIRRVAKRLCRQVLQSHLGDKPLKSRELFV